MNIKIHKIGAYINIYDYPITSDKIEEAITLLKEELPSAMLKQRLLPISDNPIVEHYQPEPYTKCYQVTISQQGISFRWRKYLSSVKEILAKSPFNTFVIPHISELKTKDECGARGRHKKVP